MATAFASFYYFIRGGNAGIRDEGWVEKRLLESKYFYFDARFSLFDHLPWHDYMKILFYEKLRHMLETICTIRDKQLVFYGAGSVGEFLSGFCRPVCFIDMDKGKVGSILNGIPIFSPDKLSELEFDYIILTPLGREKIIKNFLTMNLKIPTEKVVELLAGSGNSIFGEVISYPLFG